MRDQVSSSVCSSKRNGLLLPSFWPNCGEIGTLDAESLFIIVATQMVNPGCSTFYDGIPCIFDLRTGIISLASPKFLLMTSGSLEMGRF